MSLPVDQSGEAYHRIEEHAQRWALGAFARLKNAQIRLSAARQLPKCAPGMIKTWLPLMLPDEDTRDIVAFLESLTGGFPGSLQEPVLALLS
jgi:hypothetical protein